MPQRRSAAAAVLASLLASLAVAAAPGTVAAQVPSATVEATQTKAGNVTFSLGASVGQLAGTAYERAYGDFAGERFRLSELKWDLEDIAVAGVQASAGFGGRFRLNFGYWAALNEGDGDMVDHDWLFLDDDDWTHESRHDDTDLDSGSIVDVNLDFRALSRGSFALSAIAGYRRTEFEWSSRGGDFKYTWDYNGDGVITLDEYRRPGSFPEGQLVITYRQEYTVPYLGLGCAGAWGPVELQGHVLYSPWVSAEDHDFHALRDTTFDGDFSDGDWFGAGASATWLFLPRWYAMLSVEYQKFDEVSGDVTEISPTGRVEYGDGGSVELETVLLLFGAGFRF